MPRTYRPTIRVQIPADIPCADAIAPTRITIRTRLAHGMAPDGPKDWQIDATYPCSGRGLLRALRELHGWERHHAQCSGNVGCGSTRIFVGGDILHDADHILLRVLVDRREWERSHGYGADTYRTPTQQCADLLRQLAAGWSDVEDR